MPRRAPILPIVFLAGLCIASILSPLMAGEPASPRTIADPPSAGGADPFAEALNNGNAVVVKTGPSCQFIKIPLPPGVSLEDIPGFEAQ